MKTKKITKEVVNNLIAEFKAFVEDSIDDGMHEVYDQDPLDFLHAAMSTFVDVKSDIDEEE